MTLKTPALHRLFIQALDGDAEAESPLALKPLLVRARLPLPPLLRVYAYNLVGGIGTKRPFEYKAILRLRNHPVGEYRSFDHSDGRLALAVAFREDLDVWVMWDTSLHPRFKNGGNIQVRTDTVVTAAATGLTTQVRRLTTGTRETVVVCTTAHLREGLAHRVDTTGGEVAATAAH